MGEAGHGSNITEEKTAFVSEAQWQDLVKRFVAVGELKRFSKLFRNDKPLDLFALFNMPAIGPNAKLIRSIGRIIRKLFTYIALSGSEFAFFSCYKATWIFQRPLLTPGRVKV